MRKKPIVLFYAEAMGLGGVAVAFCEFAKELESLGCEIKALIPYQTDMIDVKIPQRYICGTIWPRRVKNKLARRFLNVLNVFTRWKAYFWFVPKIQHDIFINYFAFWNSHWCMYSKKPKIGIFHNAAPNRHGGINEQIWNHFIRGEYEKYDRMLAVSDFLADGWSERYALSQRPMVVANLLDIDSILEKGRESVALPIRGQVRRMVFVGRLAEIKGVDRLMRVMSRLKREGYDFCLNIIGDGPRREWMEQYVKEHELAENIHFLGVQLNPYPYMRQSDLLVCASYSEGFALVIKEALLMRCPVLTTDFGNASSRLKNGEWGAVVGNSEEGLYDGIRRFLSGESFYMPKCGFDVVEHEIRAEDKANRVLIRETILGLLGSLKAGEHDA